MSFGFSVGDFLAGANLAYRLIRSLSETRGASMEYQEVICELGYIQQTFLHVEHMNSSNIFSRATINAISHIMNTSIDVMARFLEKTEKYRQSLSNNGGQSLVADSWRKIGWSLFKKDELADLRNTLQTGLTAVNILISTASSQNQYMAPQAVAKFQTSSFETQMHQKSSDSSSTTTIIADDRLGGKRDEAYPKVEDHSQTHTQRGASSEEVQFIKEERNSLNEAGRENGEYLRRKAAERDAVQALAKLGMLQARPPSPPLKKKKPINFKDAVGRKFSFPFELCSTWQGMEDLINRAFLHIDIIGPHVAEGHYDLVGPNGDIILPQVWETVIEPDWTITMHMWPIPEEPQEQISVQEGQTATGILSEYLSNWAGLGLWKRGKLVNNDT